GTMPRRSVFRRKQTACQSDAGPATDAGQNGDILLTLMLIRVDIADDPRRSLELVEFVSVEIDRLDVTFQRAVEDDVAVRCERTRPDRELLGLRPDDLALGGIPGNEVAHAAMAVRSRVHRHGGTDIRLPRRIAHPVRLII